MRKFSQINNTKQTLAKLLLFFSLFFFSVEGYSQDADSDNVLDTADLDDDNDGILDTQECGPIDFNNLITEFQFEAAGFTSDAGVDDAACQISSCTLEPQGGGINIGNPSTLTCWSPTTGVVESTKGTHPLPSGNAAIFNAFANAVGNPNVCRGIADHNANGRSGEIVTISNVPVVAGQSYSVAIYVAEITNTSPHTNIYSFQFFDAGTATSAGIPSFTLDNITQSNQNWQLNETDFVSTVTKNVDVVLIQSIEQEFGADLALDAFSIVSGTCTGDTDGDGVLNIFDLDSDNDGCPDAEEGDGAFAYSAGNIQNDTLTGGVDANGIPTIAGANGQGIGDAQDDAEQACACPYGAGVDTDGDGLEDVCDLDDDNDGILDTEECNLNLMAGDYSQAVTWTFNNNPQTYEAIVSSTYVSSAADMAAGAGVTTDLGYFPTSAMRVNNVDKATYVEARANSKYVLMEFTTSSTLVPYTYLSRFKLWEDGGALDLDYLPYSFTLEISDDPSFESYTVLMQDQLMTAPNNTSFTNRFFNVEDRNLYELKTSTTYYVRAYVYDAPSTTDQVTFDDATFYFTTLPGPLCDLDDDGIANYFDLDSDNDGCPDALEGSGGFTEANIQNDSLTGGIDVNGIPTIATASGQTIGSALEESILSAVCDNLSNRALNDINNTPYNTPAYGDVSINDKDEEGDNQTFSLDTSNGGMNVADGSVTLNSNGSYNFTPANGFTGGTTFSYSVCDDGLPSICDTATVYIEVFPEVNPEITIVVANSDAHSVKSGETGGGNVMSNDLDPDDLKPAVTTILNGVTVSGVDENGNTIADAGTLTLTADGSYTFVPTGGFIGTVTQSYTICNATAPAICDNATLEIEVLADNGNTTFVNDDAVVTDSGVATTGDISANDDDNEGDDQNVTDYLLDTDGDGDGDTAGTLGVATQVGGTNDLGVYVANAGSLTLNADGTYSFTPANGFFGNVNIVYTACDDNSSTVACADATLVVTVVDVKRDYGDAPAAYPAAWHRAMTDANSDDVLDGATDVWLGTSTSFEVSQLTNASASGDANDDAMSFGSGAGQFPLAGEPLTSYDVDITLNSANADFVFYGVWIDWDNNGSYEDFYSGGVATSSPAVATVSITTPNTTGGIVNVRLRADDDPFTMSDYQGGRTNGEVEDYQATVALPVELISFKATARECNVYLEWATASEENFSHYEIERSEDGYSFTTLGKVLGSENSVVAKYYNYMDDNTLSKNYYRLKMVDIDGSYDYSNIVYTDTNCSVSDITIFPNPVSQNAGAISVNFLSKEKEVVFEVSDMLGRVLQRSALGVDAGKYNTVRLDISDLPFGSYTLRLDGEKLSKIFIVKE